MAIGCSVHQPLPGCDSVRFEAPDVTRGSRRHRGSGPLTWVSTLLQRTQAASVQVRFRCDSTAQPRHATRASRHRRNDQTENRNDDRTVAWRWWLQVTGTPTLVALRCACRARSKAAEATPGRHCNGSWSSPAPVSRGSQDHRWLVARAVHDHRHPGAQHPGGLGQRDPRPPHTRAR